MASEQHGLTLSDDGAFDFAECVCGWVSPPSPDAEIAAEFYTDHILAVAAPRPPDTEEETDG